MGKNQTLGSQIDDVFIERYAEQSIELLHLNPDTNNIVINTYNQNILVTGQVQSQKYKAEITQRLALIPDVAKVYNFLKVGLVRTQTTWMDDAYISSKVKANLLVSDASEFHFEYVTEEGVVYIMGNAPKAELEYVTDLISHISGVKKVVAIFPEKKSKKPPIYDVLPVAVES